MIMMYGLVILPLLGALAALLLPSNRHRPLVLPVFATIHLAMALYLIVHTPPPSHGGWIFLDPLGKIILLTCSVIFAFCAYYAVGYLAGRQERSNRVLCIGLLVCLSAMTLATVAHHLGLLWVAIETTTLAMAPLIYFNRNARSIEATWKYMLICSVGIALALLGLFFLAYSTIVAGLEPTLLLQPLILNAKQLSPAWLHAAFVFLLVGFGTKMGLAPLHTWKPDAYGEAPGLVGALLAGGLVNCAFLGIIRAYQVSIATGTSGFFQDTLVVMGLVSMAFAAVFMVGQSDFKRMLAYSSVEHVGILAVAIGLGKGALFGALLHLINNGLTKGCCFFSSETSTVPTAAKAATWSEGRSGGSPVRRAVPGGFHSHHRVPPLRPLRQRVHHRQQCVRSTGVSDRHRLPCLPCRYLHRHGLDGPSAGDGNGTGGIAENRIPRFVPDGCSATAAHGFGTDAGGLAAGTARETPAGWSRSSGGGTMRSLLRIFRNGEAVPLSTVPIYPTGTFLQGIIDGTDRGWRVSSYFGAPDATGVTLYCVLSFKSDGLMGIMASRADEAFPSIAELCPQVHLFEREIAEQCGIVPDGHPWLKPVRFHRSFREGADAWGRKSDTQILPGVMDFFKVEGEEIHEVAVGPVHAGIIEPGHFGFSAMESMSFTWRYPSATSIGGSKRRSSAALTRKRCTRSKLQRETPPSATPWLTA